LARLLGGHTGRSPHHIKNSIEFVQELSSLQADTHDIMVSFDNVSLFTKVPIRETMNLLGRHFLDLDIYRRSDGSLGHKVYRKPTHTNLYLNSKSHHHPSNKQAVLSTLIHRARALCDEDSLRAELVFLKDVFRENGYSDRQFHTALNRRPLLPQPDNKPHSVAFLPFAGTVFNRISRVLARSNTKSVGLPHMKLSSLLRLVKDHLGLRTPGVYRTPSECGRVYIACSYELRAKGEQIFFVFLRRDTMP
jgi:hypothetical protein